MRKITNNIVKKIITFILLLVSVLGVHTISKAVNTPIVNNANQTIIRSFNNGYYMMPYNHIDSPSGMLPQYYLNGYTLEEAYRNVYHDNSRLDWSTNSWQATMNGKVVYCSAYGRYVRYGTYDPTQHYLIPGVTNIQGTILTAKDPNDPNSNGILDPNGTVGSQIQKILDDWIKDLETELDGDPNTDEDDITYYTNIATGAKGKASDTITVSWENKVNYDTIKQNAIGEITVQTIDGNGRPSETPYNMDLAEYTAQGKLSTLMSDVFDRISKSKTPGKEYDDSIDNGIYGITLSGINGPEVVVLEQNDHTSGYKEKTNSQAEYINNKKAFIFSAAEEAYGNCNSKYTLNDIQGAYWLILNEEDPQNNPYPKSEKLTENAKTLYKYAGKYMELRQEIQDANGYENLIKFNTTEMQVVADRKEEQYIIGPVSIEYPYKQEFADLSYMKALIIKYGENEDDVLVYDEKNKDFDIVLDGTTGARGNGMNTREYPVSGQKFFVIVSAKDETGIGIDTTSINLNAKFEYITNTYAKVETELTANANVYKYYGYVRTQDATTNPNNEHLMDYGRVSIHLKYEYGTVTKDYIHCEDCPCNENEENECDDCEDCNTLVEIPSTRDNKEETYATYKIINIYQPYIKMGATPVDRREAQKLIVIGNANREYELKQKGITIDLTMEIGGHVWLDVDGGKEDISNGVYDKNEIRVPNVPVTLYRQNGEKSEKVAETKTLNKVTDINGDNLTTAPYEWVGAYYFKDLNPMYQYYVEFTYNGQYYQATKYTDSDNWKENNWPYTSNAKEKRQDRLNFNDKFETIGPAPENYEISLSSGNYNETFTALELLGFTLNNDGIYVQTRDAVIDCKWKCGKEGDTTHKHEEGCIDVVYGNLILEEPKDETYRKMIQYVKDCLIKSSTNADGAKGLYPVPSFFLIDNTPVDTKVWSTVFPNTSVPKELYDKAYYINLGLDERQQADLAIKKDIQKVTLEINGQTHEYTYDTLENKENADKEWDISVRVADGYYNTVYSRTIYASDYMYKTSIYGDAAKYGKSEKDELEVYITYKIMVNNQSTSIEARINEIVDYYDEDLEYINERSYFSMERGEDAPRFDVKASEDSRYATGKKTIGGYKNLYITGLNDRYLSAGEMAYIYLTFRVNKNDEGFVEIDNEIEAGVAVNFGVGKENLAELNSYSTRYAKGTTIPNVFELDKNGNETEILKDVGGTPAGIVDRDSKPGNLIDSGIEKENQNLEVFTKFEDDSDKAPNLKLTVVSGYAREISGNVWEDLRDEYEPKPQETRTGDGIRTNKENTLIDGVTVQLVELMDNGTEYVWREFGDKGYTLEKFNTELSQEKQKDGIGGNNTIGKGTGTGTKDSETPIINVYNLISNYEFGNNKDGAYAFKSFVPGKYVVRFIYGDTIKTVAPSSLNMGGLNEKSYNGQDYKSTTYQEGIETNKTYEWRNSSTWILGKEQLGNIQKTISVFDKYVCNQNETCTYLYDITASDKNPNVSDAKDIESARKKANSYSTGEIKNDLAEVLASGSTEYIPMNDRTQLLNKLMQNTKMTAETGIMVIELEYDAVKTDGTQDRTYKVQNVNLGLEERPKAQLMMDKSVSNVKLTLANGTVLFDATDTVNNVLWKKHKTYNVGYDKGLMDPKKFESIEEIRKDNANKFGLVQISMDEELMHGATIQITYRVSAINVGEIDYNDNRFYYTGKVANNNSVITTNAKQVIDYVANNLQFETNKNSNWQEITKAKIQSDGFVNQKIIDELDKYNTIITSTSLDKELVPRLYKENINNNAIDTVSTPLVLSKVITPENDTDELTYRNIVEIVKTTNTAGRRMAFSVVGNQSPLKDPEELDTDIAEIVKILPPFGNAGIYIIIAITTILALTIIILGTIFIKKKVLRN